MSAIEARLSELGITLPEPVAPVANYVPFVQSGHLVHVSGQISMGPEGLIAGRLGETVTLEAGIAAARQCGINLISQFKVACGGDLDRLARVVRLGGFVCAAGDFTDIPKVINGTSDLMVEVFGDAGRHARSAVACPVLPLGAAVEVDAIFELKA